MTTRGWSIRVPMLGLAVVLTTSAAVSSWSVPYANAATNAKVIASVVDVDTNLAYEDAAAAGTGIVIAANGMIVTNNHVIRGATTIKVRDVGNGRTYSANVVGYDITADVTVLKLSGANGLATAPLGNSSTVRVGANVTGIGNAGGIGGTPSSEPGTVTALNQSITASDELAGTSEQLSGLIETNAAIQAGDSGGPLVNGAGKVVGLDTAASSGFQFQYSTSNSFAIPINTSLNIARQIEAGHFSGAVHPAATAFLGVDVRSSGYFSGGGFQSGLLVAGVVPASPAEKVGLGLGDVITSFAGQSILTPAQLTNALLAYAPAKKTTLGWVDQYGTSHSATVTLASGPPQ
jgi:S1-C subfamily serine protease